MLKNRVWYIFFMLVLLSCEEPDVNFRSTAPIVNFSFKTVADNKNIMPDSVIYAGTDSIHYFSDTLASYLFPVDYTRNESRYFFFFGQEVTDVSLFYDLEVVDDIDRIRYKANLQGISASIDSLVVVCQDTIKCTSDGATVTLFY